MLHEIVTSEKVPFTYRVAGLGSRGLAALADLGVIVVLAVIGVMIMAVYEVGRRGFGTAVGVLWLFFLLIGYFLMFEWLWLGQTPGKKLLGIRVIQWDGTSLSFTQSALRNLARVIDVLPGLYGVAMVVALCNREQRRLGDLAAGTLVVHQERGTAVLRALHGQRSEAERDQEEAVRRRLDQLDRKQRQGVLDLCLRRDQLRIRTRTRLFASLAEYCRTQLGITPRPQESDEKMVLRLATLIGGGGARAGEVMVAGLRPTSGGSGPSMRSSE
jgi:uncharacterized RDD family membrane protein YckC